MPDNQSQTFVDESELPTIRTGTPGVYGRLRQTIINLESEVVRPYSLRQR